MVFELRLVNLRSWSSNLSKMEYTFHLIQKLQNLEKKKRAPAEQSEPRDCEWANSSGDGGCALQQAVLLIW